MTKYFLHQEPFIKCKINMHDINQSFSATLMIFLKFLFLMDCKLFFRFSCYSVIVHIEWILFYHPETIIQTETNWLWLKPIIVHKTMWIWNSGQLKSRKYLPIEDRLQKIQIMW